MLITRAKMNTAGSVRNKKNSQNSIIYKPNFEVEHAPVRDLERANEVFS